MAESNRKTFAAINFTPRETRLAGVFLGLILGLFVGIVVMSVTLDLLPETLRSLPLVVCGVGGMALGFRSKSHNPWKRVTVVDGRIELTGAHGNRQVEPDDLCSVLALRGLDTRPFGKHAWNALHLMTKDEHYLLRMDTKKQDKCFELIRRISRGAVAFDAAGELHLPELPAPDRDTLIRARKAYSRAALKDAALVGFLLLLGIVYMLQGIDTTISSDETGLAWIPLLVGSAVIWRTGLTITSLLIARSRAMSAGSD